MWLWVSPRRLTPWKNPLNFHPCGLLVCPGKIELTGTFALVATLCTVTPSCPHCSLYHVTASAAPQLHGCFCLASHTTPTPPLPLWCCRCAHRHVRFSSHVGQSLRPSLLVLAISTFYKTCELSQSFVVKPVGSTVIFSRVNFITHILSGG